MDAVYSPKLVANPRAPRRDLLWLVPCALILASGLCLSIDIPVASFFQDKQLPAAILGPLTECLEICEAFGHGFGATLIIIAIGVLNPSLWRCVPWTFAGSLGAGLMANTVKLVISRSRPREFDDLAVRTVWDTFAAGATSAMGTQSFPSAHTATAVGLAVMLSTLFPKGRWYFATLATLVGMQRVVVSAHFPSDIFAGALVGWLVGSVCANAMALGAEKRR